MRMIGHGVFLAMMLCLPAAARDVHVSNRAGDDRFSGQQVSSRGDETGPVRTIGRALQLARSGDRIVLAETGEPYRESITLSGSRHSGSAYKPFTIEGSGAVLDGSAPVPPDAWTHDHDDVFRFHPTRKGPQQLFLDDRPAERVAMEPGTGELPSLEPRQWYLHESAIYFCVEKDKLPEDYDLRHAHLPTGITLYHVGRVAIVNLTVQGFRLDGINAFNSARDVYLGGVTARGNGRSGIAAGGASKVQIDASLIGNNGRAQLLTLPHSETAVRNSEIFANTAPARVDRGGRLWINEEKIEGNLNEDVTTGNVKSGNVTEGSITAGKGPMQP